MVAALDEWVTVDQGSGPAAVFVHGLASDSSVWSRVAENLLDECRIVGVDVPGISLMRLNAGLPSPSPRELGHALDAALARRGIDRYHLVGHSYGAVVAMVCAYSFPRQVASTTLVAPGGFGPEVSPLVRLMGSRTGSASLRLLHRPIVRRRLYRAIDKYRGKTDARFEIDQVVETYERLGSRDAQQQFKRSVSDALALRRDSHSDMPSMWRDQPLQILWGQNDLVLPAWHADHAKVLYPWAEVHIIEGAGHTPQRTHVAEICRLLRSFWSSVPIIEGVRQR